MSVVAFDPIVSYVNEAANYTFAQHPNLVKTLHDIECPPGRGWVVSLMGPGYFGNPNTQASAQLMVDAADVGQGVTLGYQAWHVGGPGNQISDGMEQAGYACFTTPMWTGTAIPGVDSYVNPGGQTVVWTAQDNIDMAAQLELVARTMARLKASAGTELKWLTAAEHQQAADDYNNGRPAVINGWVRHRDWTDRGLSNTSHRDTGDNYPQDLVMAKAIAYYNGTPAPVPAPVPTPPEGLFMSLTPDQELQILAAAQLITGDVKPKPFTPIHTLGDIASSTGPFINGTSTFAESMHASLGGITAAITKFAAVLAAKK